MTDRTVLDDADWLRTQAATKSASAIAAEVGVAAGTVLRRMRLHGITPRSGRRRVERPVELSDPVWLRARYANATVAVIAEELNTPVGVVYEALYDAGVELRDRRERLKFSAAVELSDPVWLRARYNEGRTGAEIARELRVSRPAVYAAMRRHGLDLDGAWVRRDLTRLESPGPDELRRAYEFDESMKAVGLRYGVSATTATIWLADIGIFASDTPRLSRRQLEEAIAAGWTIRQIAHHHRAGPRSVAVELRRHGLFDAHRHRPSP